MKKTEKQKRETNQKTGEKNNQSWKMAVLIITRNVFQTNVEKQTETKGHNCIKMSWTIRE